MVTTRYYLDRRQTKEGPAPIRLMLNRRSQTAMLTTGVKVLPDQWDKLSMQVVRHPQRSGLNTFLAKFKIKVDELLRDLMLSGEIADLDAKDIKNIVEERLLGKKEVVTLSDVMEIHYKGRSPQTIAVYDYSVGLAQKFDSKLMIRNIRSVSHDWAENFTAWLNTNYAGNTRKTVVANMSALFNTALMKGIIRSNPFRGIKNPLMQTRKRNLTAEQLRILWNEKPRSDREEYALDLFKFSFLLIAANPVDIAGMKLGNIFNGRIEYRRAKTKKNYSIKIEEELLPLIAKYTRGDKLFWPLPQKEKDRLTATANYDAALKRMALRLGLPPVTLYWARHSWASLAIELGYPVDVVSSALGHSHGTKVTMVYISFDLKKVDEANRKVIDYVLKDKKSGSITAAGNPEQ